MVGNIKYTKEIINSRLEYRGITVLDEYKGYQVNLNFKCKNGHTWLATPSNVLRKTGCPHCNGGVSFTDTEMQEIKSSLELRGITFDEYKNSTTKVEFKCKEGHNWKTTLPIYNSEILGFKTEATKLDFETVINIIETQLLEKEYNV